jgi:hypothetical protein
MLGRAEENVREGELAVKMWPIEQYPGDWGGFLLRLLAITHVQLGEQERAIDVLEKLLKCPYRISPA